MYPERELSALAFKKAALQLEIAHRRLECAEAAAQVARPLEWLDRVVSFWRKLSPLAKFAAIPLGILAKRAASGRLRMLGTLMRWGPLVIGAVRGMKGAAGTHRGCV